LPEALRKPRERNGIADARHRRRPGVSEINHTGETFRWLFLCHPKRREIEIRIAIDQSASKVQASRSQHRDDLVRFTFGSFECSDHVIRGDPDRSAIKAQNEAGCSA
jgi:hypothetical protein